MSSTEQNQKKVESTMRGLKTTIVKRNKAIVRKEKTIELCVDSLIHSWNVMLDNKIGESIISEIIWDISLKGHVHANVYSEPLGIKSTISDYTNKLGKTHKAHYSMYGKYLCPASKGSKLGDEPAYYQGEFPVNRLQFKIDFTKLKNATEIEDLFVVNDCTKIVEEDFSDLVDSVEEKPNQVIGKRLKKSTKVPKVQEIEEIPDLLDDE